MNNSTATTAPSAIQQGFDQAQLADIAAVLNANELKPERQPWHPEHNTRYKQDLHAVMADMGYKWCHETDEDGSEELYFFLEYDSGLPGFGCDIDTLGVTLQINLVWSASLLYGHWPLPPRLSRRHRALLAESAS